MKAATAALLGMTWIVTAAGAAMSTVDCDAGEEGTHKQTKLGSMERQSASRQRGHRAGHNRPLFDHLVCGC